MKKAIFAWIAVIVTVIALSVKSSEFYYAEAYVYSQTEIGDGEYEIRWSVRYNKDEEIFITYNEEKIDEDNIYLLTMDSKHTNSILDDEICVIWGAVNTMK